MFSLVFLPKRNFSEKFNATSHENERLRDWIYKVKSSVSAKNKWKQEIKRTLWKELHLSCYNSNVMNYYKIVAWNYDWVQEKEVITPHMVTINSIRSLQIQVHSTGLSGHQWWLKSKILWPWQVKIIILTGGLTIFRKIKNGFLDFGKVLRVLHVKVLA